jgi:hypothetical protein
MARWPDKATMFSMISSLLGSYLEARAIKGVSKEIGDYLDRWARLVASITITALVVFPFIMGSTALALWQTAGIWTGLGVGFATALVTTSLVVYNLWVRSPLTKGISIAVPSQLAAAAVNQNVTITTRT